MKVNSSTRDRGGKTIGKDHKKSQENFWSMMDRFITLIVVTVS